MFNESEKGDEEQRCELQMLIIMRGRCSQPCVKERFGPRKEMKTAKAQTARFRTQHNTTTTIITITITHNTNNLFQSRPLLLNRLCGKSHADVVDRDLVEAHFGRNAWVSLQQLLQLVLHVRLLCHGKHEPAAARAGHRLSVHMLLQQLHDPRHKGRLAARRHDLLLRPVAVEARTEADQVLALDGLRTQLCIGDEAVDITHNLRGTRIPVAHDVLQQVAGETRAARVDEQQVVVQFGLEVRAVRQRLRLDPQRQGCSGAADLKPRHKAANLILPAAARGEHLLQVQHGMHQAVGAEGHAHCPPERRKDSSGENATGAETRTSWQVGPAP
eukprot:m.197450 g.197450  ORF g.197450 m.197450 type:complete len:330 (+) comp17665_c0_seq1:1030-2019(+)